MTSTLDPRYSGTALVVDDDPLSRNMICFALSSAGFHCIEAVNGNDALAKLSAREVNLVVSDLKMPGRNGHSLAVELLQRPRRPLIAIHTAVTDPRLTEDLMIRGVDDIVFKPTNYPAFAAKMRGLAKHRRESQLTEGVNSELDHCSAATDGVCRRISLDAIRKKIKHASHLLPISQAALDVVNLIRSDECADSSSIASIVEKDPALCVEVLRIAHGTSIVAGRRASSNLCEAINIIGTRRIGEAAVAVNAMGLLTRTVLPWLDVRIAELHRRATRHSLNRTLGDSPLQTLNEGLNLGVALYGAGRLLLGMLYPDEYRCMIEHCAKHNLSLAAVERSTFPMSPSAALAELLITWKVPVEYCQVLRHLDYPYSSLSHLPNQVRRLVELLKTAATIGQCASHAWHAWDVIELPPSQVLERLGLNRAHDLISLVKNDIILDQQQGRCSDSSLSKMHLPEDASEPNQIRFSSLSSHASDFLEAVICSMGFKLANSPCQDRTICKHSVVNCLETPSTVLAARGVLAQGQELVMVTDVDLPQAFSSSGQVVCLPTSYSALKKACLRIVQ